MENAKERQQIGEKIRVVRKKKKMTQKELSNIVGVRQDVISDYENGSVKVIPFDKRVKISRVLGLSINDLLYDAEKNSVDFVNIFDEVSKRTGGGGTVMLGAGDEEFCKEVEKRYIELFSFFGIVVELTDDYYKLKNKSTGEVITFNRTALSSGMLDGFFIDAQISANNCFFEKIKEIEKEKDFSSEYIMSLKENIKSFSKELKTMLDQENSKHQQEK